MSNNSFLITSFPWYGIMVVFGSSIASLFIYIRWREQRYSNWNFSIIMSFGLLIALFGARWWYLIFHPSHYTNLIDIFKISEGRAIQGSIFFGTIWLFIYSKYFSVNLEFKKIASIIIPNLLIAQSIGRWGNFFNQEIYGGIVSEEFISLFPSFIKEGMFIDGEYRNPLFLWESITNMIGWILLSFFIYDSKWIKEGSLIGLYLIWYGITRSSMELFRNEQFIMNINGIPTSFILSIIFAFVGLLIFIYYQLEILEKINAKINLEIFICFLKGELKILFNLCTFKIKYSHFTTFHCVLKNRYNYIK